MANLLDKYGIKEVADVTFYENDTDGSTIWTNPVLYLDTLKVSTIEQTAENVSARGGKGNPELITWDYNKEITLTLEDALFSAKSLAFMFGTDAATSTSATVTQVVPISDMNTDRTKWIAPDGSTVSPTTVFYIGSDGNTTSITTSAVAAVITYTAYNMHTITIDSDKFPKAYTIVGDTFARPNGGSKDEMFQFIIPNAKVNSEVTFTLEAEGDPTTFNMSVRVLKPAQGKNMMILKKYTVTE